MIIIIIVLVNSKSIEKYYSFIHIFGVGLGGTYRSKSYIMIQ